MQIGVQFLLGLQLIVVAILHFISKPSKTKFILALLCLILGLWFFKKVFYGYWQEHIFLFILIGPGKPIFAVSLLLFYYKSYSTELKSNYVVKYLIAPLVYYVTLIAFRFFLIEEFSGANKITSLLFSLGVFMIFWWYFFLTRKELRTQVRKKLIPKAYKKVMFLFYSLYFFLLQIPFWDILRNLVNLEAVSNSTIESSEHYINNIFIIAGKLIPVVYGYLYLLGYFLFLYALSELASFKRLFLPKNVAINENTLKNKIKLDNLIDYHFHQEKIYKNTDLSIGSCATIFEVSTKELIDYFKITNKGVFKDYINNLRVNEFKMLLENEEFNHYDLVGLAKDCGFKSKSTFFRVFKDIEGITPNEYKKSLI